MKVLIIIPAYNEGKTILNIINSIKKESFDINGEYTLDYVIINDCSTDNTLQVCIDNNLNVVDLPINLGIGGAVQTGYKYAYENNYDIAIQIDADGQHDPKYIDDLVKEINNGNDMVIASRFIDKVGFQSTFIRRLGINWYAFLIKFFTKVNIKDITSGYRAINSKIIKIFAVDYPYDYPEPETNALLAKRKFKIKEIPVQMKERQAGKSSITPFKSIHYAVKVSLAVIMASIKKQKE